MINFKFPENDYTHVLFTTVKNDGPYLLDWIAYHLKIGFTHFAIATNNCEDGSDNLLRQLEDYGIVTLRNNPGPHPQGIEKHGFMRLQELDAIQNAEWLMHLDIDEYLRIDIGRGEVLDIVAALAGAAQAVSFVTQVFGDNGVAQLIDEPVISQFTRASHPLQAVPAPVCALKTFYQNGYFDKLSSNRPLGLDKKVDFDDFNWFDADGVANKKIAKSQVTHAEQNGYTFGTALGRVNRYAVQSLDAFANKWRSNQPLDTISQKLLSEMTNDPEAMDAGTLSPREYWLRNNWNVVENKRILTHLDRTNQIKESLLHNEKIKKLHRRTFRTHRQWANQALRNETKFYDSFIGVKPLQFCTPFPLLPHEEPVPLLKEWFVNTTLLRQKLLVTNFLNFYVDGVDYGPTATELPK